VAAQEGKAMTDDDREPVRVEVVRDLLLLCGVTVPVEIVAAQTPGDMDRAARWAAAVHLRASDNDDAEEVVKPQWVARYEFLAAEGGRCEEAVAAWDRHLAETEGSRRRVLGWERLSLELGTSAVTAQRLIIFGMRERIAAALATATGRSARAGVNLEWVISTMTRELLGSDELYEEFKARFGYGQEQEGERP
jgi:hypothetical protein